MAKKKNPALPDYWWQPEVLDPEQWAGVEWEDESQDAMFIRNLHEEIISTVRGLENLQAAERLRDQDHVLIYRNFEGIINTFTTAGLEYFIRQSGLSLSKLNIARSVVDKLNSRLTRETPGVKSGTDGAGWKYRQKAKKVSKFLNTKLRNTGFRSESARIQRDSSLRGTGIARVYSEDGNIKIRRVLKSYLTIDPWEALYGNPRQLFETSFRTKEELKALYPEFEEEIEDAPRASLGDYYEDHQMLSERGGDRMVRVVEAWHVPSSSNADDGRYAKIIDGATLEYCEWDRPRFPHAFLHWKSPDTGFWGSSLMEELAGPQWEFNRALATIGEQMKWAKLRVWVDRKTKLNKNWLDTRVGTVGTYDGDRPIFDTTDVGIDQWIMYLQLIEDRIHRFAGMTAMTAEGKTPNRFDSKGALLAFYDIEDQTLSTQKQQFRDFHLEVAQLILDEAKELYLDSDSPEPDDWIDRSLRDEIPWEEVNSDSDEFRLHLEAVSLLPQDWSGKIEMVTELAKAGLSPKELLAPNMDHPDVEHLFARINAADNNTRWTIERLEDITFTGKDGEEKDPSKWKPKSEIPAPHAYQELPYTITMVKAAYQDAEAKEAPTLLLDRYDAWIQDALAVLEENQPQLGSPAPAGAPAEGFDQAVAQGIQPAGPTPPAGPAGPAGPPVPPQ